MKKFIIILLILKNTVAFSQSEPKPYGPLPSERQLRWQETELYSIIHFSMATYFDKEWGYGDEKLESFKPSDFSALQILGAAKAGGVKAVVVVAKHHDGFCLWPTQTTQHNISNTPYKTGKGDIVKEYQLASGQLGMKMGIYLSPWDRNNALYGEASYTEQIYRKQLKELYSSYGDLFMSWHDGANGGDGYYGGAREQRKIDKSNYYGWDETWKITRKLQPGAAIFGDAGPDVRWIGNEEGLAGEPCWETFTPHASEGTVPANGNVKYWESVNGTRNGIQWMPAECDVALRPGWFYHKSQDGQSKTPYQLVNLYYESVGRGACLDLGLSPDQSGRLTEEDVNKLKRFGEIIKQTFDVNYARNAIFIPSNVRGNNKNKYGTKFLQDKDRYTYWATDNNIVNPTLTIKLKSPQTFNVIRIRENIKLGQRIDSVDIQAYQNNGWQKIAHVTSIGANRLVRLKQNVNANRIRFKFYAPVCVAISDIGVFKEPVHLTTPAIKKDKDGKITISTEAPVGSINYTTDGSEPNLQSKVFTAPFNLYNGGVVKAVGFEEKQHHSDVATRTFDINKQGWKIIVLDSAISANAIYKIIDDDENTHWEDNKISKNDEISSITIDMGKTNIINAFTYLPRQDKKIEGIAERYVFMISDDRRIWSTAAEGEFSNIKSNPVIQVVSLKSPIRARYFMFKPTRLAAGDFSSIAELGVR